VADNPALTAPRPPPYVLPPAGQLPAVQPIADPFVDDSPAGPPGFFGKVELFFLRPHLNTHLSGSPNQGVDTVFLTTEGSLGTTVSPWFTLGYRLPEQLGEFSLAYRFETDQRSTFPTDPLGGVDERDRLNVNMVDLDYGHDSPFALGPGWDLRFNVGVRVATIYFDTRRCFAPPGNAAGQLEERATSDFWGIGPEAGCDLSRQIFLPGLALYGRAAGAHLFGEIHQSFAETTSGPAFAADGFRYQVAVPMLTLQAGLSYAPPGWQGSYFLFGYVWEEFWQVGRLHDQSNGSLLNRGLFLRAVFNF
jgi:hypothetical protein